MTRHVCLICEGIQDSVFISMVLAKQFQLTSSSLSSQEDHPWYRAFKDATSPPRSGLLESITNVGDSERRGPKAIPSHHIRFLADSHALVWLSHAGGVNNLAKHADVVLGALGKAPTRLDALGFVIDSDAHLASKCLDSRGAELKQILAVHGFPVPTSWTPGRVDGLPPVGVFVMPNCRDPGTLEDLLVACGSYVYPSLHGAAHSLVSSRESLTREFDERDRQEISKPAGPQKATLAVMGAFLKPGRTIQTTLEDHRWVSEATLLLPELQPLVGFLGMLLRP